MYATLPEGFGYCFDRLAADGQRHYLHAAMERERARGAECFDAFRSYVDRLFPAATFTPVEQAQAVAA